MILFHELGHAIHNLVSKTIYSRFHGTEVAEDFGEAPSQMLENWCWTPIFLKSLGQHFSYMSSEYFKFWKESSNGAPQPPSQMPDEMIENIVRLRNTNSAGFFLEQLQLCAFDMMIHQPKSNEAVESLDLAREYNKLVKDIQMFDVPDSSDAWNRSFVAMPHFMENYDAGYYSYLL